MKIYVFIIKGKCYAFEDRTEAAEEALEYYRKTDPEWFCTHFESGSPVDVSDPGAFSVLSQHMASRHEDFIEVDLRPRLTTS